MTDQVYLQPMGFAASPQAADGDAIRLGGSMIYAHYFALVLRRDGRVIERELVTPKAMPDAIASLPQPARDQAEAQWQDMQRSHGPLQLGERAVPLDQPQVVGILNVTPDSFSDGGAFLDDPEAGQAHAAAMLEAGAALVDIGGESTRPGAAAVWEGEEKNRVLPAVEYCAKMGAAISVDTRRPEVMEAALDSGAHMINDVSALRHDPRALGLVAARACPVVLMHAPGSGEDLHGTSAHEKARYDNVLFDVFDWLAARRDAALEAGIARERIILDPGIGFGKSLADNLALLNGFALFHALGQPLMLGASRKRMIGALSHEAGAAERLGGSIALAMQGMSAGAHLLRVHDVAETVQARNVWRGMRDAAVTDFSGIPAA